MDMIFSRFIPFALILIFAAAGHSRAGEVFYTFKDGDASGVARLEVLDDRFGEVTRLSGELELSDAFKIVRVGNYVVAAAESEGKPGLFIGATDGTSGGRFVPLESKVSELIPAGDHVLIAVSKGKFFLVDPERPDQWDVWNARKELSPPGRKGEDLLLLPDGRAAFASFQKDDDNSDATGSRVVLLDLAPLKLRHDLQLPRDRPELHIPGNPKEQGPNPEKVFVFPDSNVLALTLDLYGAVAFMDLDAALRGDIKNYSTLPTSGDGTWGVSFPDRGLGFQFAGGDWLLVTNASEGGGYTLFDARKRELVRHYPAKVGGEKPIFLESTGKIVSAQSGKVKRRAEDILEKEILPENELMVFDVAQLVQGDPAAMQTVAVPFPPSLVVALASGNLLLFGSSEALILKPDGSIIERKQLLGSPIRVTQ
jgi:hypothetical protein